MEINLKYFNLSNYNFNENNIEYYSIIDNYKLDDFCQIFYEKNNSNPYFINKWYAMDSMHKFLYKNLTNKNNYILELGSGLGITYSLLKKYGFNIFSFDFEFFSCYLSKQTALKNKITPKIINADWNYSPFKNKFDTILGIDIIYDKINSLPIYNFINNNLKINGNVYIANFDNYAYDLLIKNFDNKNFKLSTFKSEKDNNYKINIYEFKKIS